MTNTFKTLMCGVAIAGFAAAPAIAGNGQYGDKTMTKTTMTTTTSADMDFAAYDMNSDGSVDFKEFSKHAKKKGMTTTQAAQVFTKMTNGQATLDQGTFMTAMAFGPDYYLSNVTTRPNTAVLSSTSTSYSINPDAGLNSVSPLTDAPSPMVLDGEATYPDFETTGEYSQPLGSSTTTYTGTGTYSTGAMPSATIEPMYRPEDKVLGDRTMTPATNMQTQDYNKKFKSDAEIDTTYSNMRNYEVDGTMDAEE